MGFVSEICCDGPGCERSEPAGFRLKGWIVRRQFKKWIALQVEEDDLLTDRSVVTTSLIFCSWRCVRAYAAGVNAKEGEDGR